MLKHRNIDRICCWVLVCTLLIACAYMGAGAAGLITPSRSMGYEKRLFDTGRVHTLDIVMEDWEGFLSTCINEEYAACHLVIDGESYKNTAIRAKGNTSLSSVSQYGNDRYSFKIEFDHYQPGRTYHGLDKLSLNNLIQDNTYLKDYFAYTLMRMGGAAAPLCSFVQISVNGEPWGLYLAVEGVEDSFLARNYGNDAGELYKPDSMSFGAGRGNGRDFDMENFRQQLEAEEGGAAGMGSAVQNEGMGMPQEMTPPEGMEMPQGMTPPEGMEMPGGMTPPEGMEMPGGMTPPEGMEMPGGMTPSEGMEMPGTEAATGSADAPGAAFGNRGGAKGGMGSRGSADVMLQYIDDDPASYANIFDNAKTNVTEADQQRLIRSLKALSEGDASVVDQQAVLRYLAVHNFLCNDDSYTGNMVHNYYLYEKDGVLSMLPWDYNLAFGGFGMGGGFGSSGATATVNQAIDSPVTGGELSSRPIVAWVFADEAATAAYHDAYRSFMDAAFTGGWFETEIDRVSAMIAPYVEKDPTAFCTYEEFQTGVAALREFCLLRAESVQGQLEGSIPSTTDAQRNTAALVDASHLTLSDMGSMGNTMGGDRGGFGGERRQGFGGRMQPGSMMGGGASAAPAGDMGRIEAVSPAGTADRTAVPSGGALKPAEAAVQAGQPSARPVSAIEAADTRSLPLLIVCFVLLAAAIVLANRYRTNL